MKMKKYTPRVRLQGAILGMPGEAYHSAPGISKSGLDKVARSPAHYEYAPVHAPSRAMALGSATHAAILEPAVFASEYQLLSVPDRRASAYKEAAKIHGADYVLSQPESDAVVGMAEAVRSSAAVPWLERITAVEVSLFAMRNGHLIKARPDAITTDEQGRTVLLDLKTARDARPWQFSRAIQEYRYHVQAAWYLDIYREVSGDKDARFVFLAVESEHPHASKVYELDDTSVEIGRSLADRDFATYCECAESGIWPSYPQDGSAELIAIPEWAIMDYESETGSDLISA